MNIFSNDILIETAVQTRGLVSQMFGAILDAVGENIATSWMGLWGGVISGEWSTMLVFGLTLASALVYGYRLIRANILDSIEHLGSKL